MAFGALAQCRASTLVSNGASELGPPFGPEAYERVLRWRGPGVDSPGVLVDSGFSPADFFLGGVSSSAEKAAKQWSFSGGVPASRAGVNSGDSRSSVLRGEERLSLDTLKHIVVVLEQARNDCKGVLSPENVERGVVITQTLRVSGVDTCFCFWASFFCGY